MSGDFEFRSDLRSYIFLRIWETYAIGNSYENPTSEYQVPRDTFVYIPIDGVVSL